MSGTRKMDKFELDAFQKAREDEAAKKGGQLETQGAAAIAELQPGALLDGLDAKADLPERTFEPRTAGADLPAVPFEPRPASGGPAAPDLPALAFEPRGVKSAVANSAAPTNAEANKAPGTPGNAWVPGEWIPPQRTDPPPSSRAKKLDEQDAEALRTRLTRKFVSLADSFTDAFRDFTIGAGAYAIELTAPQGMSTEGGKQALQHIRLRPRREGYAVLVAGTVNQLERRAELRDYDHVAVVNEVRFRQAIDIGQQEWEQLLRKAEVVLNGAGIQSMRTPPTQNLLEQRRRMRRVSRGALITLMVVLVLVAVVAWRVVVALSTGR